MKSDENDAAFNFIYNQQSEMCSVYLYSVHFTLFIFHNKIHCNQLQSATVEQDSKAGQKW